MSGITGEIGYKIGAAGNNLPWVGGRALTAGTGQVALAINGARGQFALSIVGGTAPSGNSGLYIQAGAASTDTSVLITGTATSTVLLELFGDGHGMLGWNNQGQPMLSWNNSGIPTFNSGGSLFIQSANAATVYYNFSNGGLKIENMVAGGNASASLQVFESGGQNSQQFAVGAAIPATVIGTSSLYTWGTGTHYPILQMAGVGAVFGTGTIGLVLTGGGLYWNGTNYIYGQAGTGIIETLGTGSYTVACVSTAGTAGGTATLTTVFSIGGTVTSNKIQGYGPTAAAMVDMTPDTGTFNGTLTGVSNTVNPACRWARNGNLVSLSIDAGNSGTFLGTSNATSMTLTGLPAAIQPANAQGQKTWGLQDNGTVTDGGWLIAAAGSLITFYKGTSQSGASWTASGQKGFSSVNTLTYSIA